MGPPTISGAPTTLNLNADTGQATTEVTWTPPIAYDNSGAAVTLTSNYNPGDLFTIGNTTVVYTAVDVYMATQPNTHLTL